MVNSFYRLNRAGGLTAQAEDKAMVMSRVAIQDQPERCLGEAQQPDA